MSKLFFVGYSEPYNTNRLLSRTNRVESSHAGPFEPRCQQDRIPRPLYSGCAVVMWAVVSACAAVVDSLLAYRESCSSNVVRKKDNAASRFHAWLRRDNVLPGRFLLPEHVLQSPPDRLPDRATAEANWEMALKPGLLSE